MLARTGPGGGEAHDVPGADLRPPTHRRSGGGHLPQIRGAEGPRPDASAARPVAASAGLALKRDVFLSKNNGPTFWKPLLCDVGFFGSFKYSGRGVL